MDDDKAAQPVARLQEAIATPGLYDVVILDRSRCHDDMPLYAAPVAAQANYVAFNPNAVCSPTLTQCPRCNNPHNACDRGAAQPTDAQSLPTLTLEDEAKYWRSRAMLNKQVADSLIAEVDRVLTAIGMSSGDREYVLAQVREGKPR